MSRAWVFTLVSSRVSLCIIEDISSKSLGGAPVGFSQSSLDQEAYYLYNKGYCVTLGRRSFPQSVLRYNGAYIFYWFWEHSVSMLLCIIRNPNGFFGNPHLWPQCCIRKIRHIILWSLHTTYWSNNHAWDFQCCRNVIGCGCEYFSTGRVVRTSNKHTTTVAFPLFGFWFGRTGTISGLSLRRRVIQSRYIIQQSSFIF